jgi:hypothetical protein
MDTGLLPNINEEIISSIFLLIKSGLRSGFFVFRNAPVSFVKKIPPDSIHEPGGIPGIFDFG